MDHSHFNLPEMSGENNLKMQNASKEREKEDGFIFLNWFESSLNLLFHCFSFLQYSWMDLDINCIGINNGEVVFFSNEAAHTKMRSLLHNRVLSLRRRAIVSYSHWSHLFPLHRHLLPVGLHQCDDRHFGQKLSGVVIEHCWWGTRPILSENFS